jgi:hypothetical protein
MNIVGPMDLVTNCGSFQVAWMGVVVGEVAIAIGQIGEACHG